MGVVWVVTPTMDTMCQAWEADQRFPRARFGNHDAIGYCGE